MVCHELLHPLLVLQLNPSNRLHCVGKCVCYRVNGVCLQCNELWRMVACQHATLSIWANCSRHEKLRVTIPKSPDKELLMIAHNSY